MEPIALVGILFIVVVVVALLYRSYKEKRRIEQARLLVDLQDALRRMQNAIDILPNVYLDKPTKVFIYKRLIHITRSIAETEQTQAAAMASLEDNLTSRMETARGSPDTAVKNLSQWAEIPSQDAAHEMRRLVQFLHQEVIKSAKSGFIPKAHAARVVKNLKITATRVPLDLAYALGKAAYQTKKYRPAMSKFKVAQGMIKRSPVRKHLSNQNGQLEELIKECEAKLKQIAEENKAKSGSSLAEGMDKIEEDSKWDQKKNYFED